MVEVGLSIFRDPILHTHLPEFVIRTHLFMPSRLLLPTDLDNNGASGTSESSTTRNASRTSPSTLCPTSRATRRRRRRARPTGSTSTSRSAASRPSTRRRSPSPRLHGPTGPGQSVLQDARVGFRSRAFARNNLQRPFGIARCARRVRASRAAPHGRGARAAL